MAFFKKVQNNVAHTSKLPALGNQDRRNLQDLITSEKIFIQSNSRSATDFKKNSEALKTWCAEEGDDLNDVVGKISLLLDHYSASQNRLNSHLSNVRLHFKSIRTREETYADLKSRKRSLGSDIEKVERKLSKMGPENKELMKITSQLKDMRSEMESLRIEVMNEEAAIGDFKRRTVKDALGIKAGALLELAEKTTILSEASKSMLDELSLYPTTPGMPRAEYMSYAKTEALLHEATRNIADVAFTPAGPSAGIPRFADRGDTTTASRDITHQYGADTDAYYDVPTHPSTNDNQLDTGYTPAPNMPNADHDDDDLVTHTPIYAAHASRTQPVIFDPMLNDNSTGEWAETSREDELDRSRNVHGLTPPVSASAAAAAAMAATAGADLNQVPGHKADATASNGGFLMQNSAPSNQQHQPGSTRNSADYQSAQGGHSSGAQFSAPEMANGASTQSHASDAYDGYTSSNIQPPSQSHPTNMMPASGSTGMLGAPLLPPLRTATPLNDATAVAPPSNDSAYFQSIGSTRAMQEAMRQPASPQAANRTASYGGLGAGGPGDGGKKVTAAAFRRGFNRNPSNQSGMGGAGSPSGPGSAYDYHSSNPLPVPPTHAGLTTPQPPGGYTNVSTPDTESYPSHGGGHIQPLNINKRHSNPHAALGAAAAAGTPVMLQGRRYSNENDGPSDLHPYNNPESASSDSPAPPYLPNPHTAAMQPTQPQSPHRTPQQQYQQQQRYPSQYAEYAAPPPPGYGYA